ncbi:MAG: hypothetical protein WA009_14765 [Phototrophicaceae bacterium]|jgi:hypothetical protein|nr:hypothetical protein [Chloroflexota bacterium]
MFAPFVPFLAQTEPQIDSLVTVLWNFFWALLEPFVTYGAANPAGCTLFALVLVFAAMLIRAFRRPRHFDNFDRWE